MLNIVEVTVVSSPLLLAAVLVRALASRRLPRQAFTALWGVALFRLLVPLPLPSPMSVQTLYGRLSGVAGTASLPSSPAKIQTLFTPQAASHPAQAPLAEATVTPSPGSCACGRPACACWRHTS